MGSRGLPTVVISRSQASSTCCCLHFQFLQTVPGTLKLAQLMIGSLCESLLITYGMSYSSVIGPAFASFLTTVSSCLWTTTLLLVCYLFSANSYRLIRSSLLLNGIVFIFSIYRNSVSSTTFGLIPSAVSLQEPIFSAAAALSLAGASVYMVFSVKLYLYPLYLITLGFAAYPAMMAAYMLGFVLSALYSLDAYHAYRHYKGFQ